MGSIYVWGVKTGSDAAGPEPTDKNAIYVGQTTGLVATRTAQHVAASKTSKRSEFEAKLATDGHRFGVKIVESNLSQGQLDAKEQHYIQQFRTHTSQGGYNETWGG